VDLTEYSTVVPDPVTIPFIGFRPDGSTVTNSFTTPGYSGTGPLTFQTYLFGPEFIGVNRVKFRPPAGLWTILSSRAAPSLSRAQAASYY